MSNNEARTSAEIANGITSEFLNGRHESFASLCASVHKDVKSFLQKDFEEATLRSVQQQCRHTLAIIQSALDRYPSPELSLSYNGGKDCLVLLLLYLSALHARDDIPESLSAIYIPPAHPFPEVDSFVKTSSSYYHLSLSRYSSPKNSMRDAFSHYLASPTGKAVKAIFVGTRRTDPHGEDLRDFDMTDHGWPSFMRVHPVLEWKYVEVWAFLRQLDVRWCRLYDEGFTSLGGMRDTHPNPVLRYVDAEQREKFRPAWFLTEDAHERLGRS